jgi:cytochrome b561
MIDATPRYRPALRRLHWLMAVLVLLVYVAIEQRGMFARGTPARAAMVQAHFWLGLSVFAFAWWRLAVRRNMAVPPITPAPVAWQATIAKFTHVALYAFFLVMPLLGLATAWTDGKVLLLPFTGIALPPLLPENEALAHTLEDIHGWIGTAFYWVIGAHVLASVYHHVVQRDDTLRRML